MYNLYGKQYFKYNWLVNLEKKSEDNLSLLSKKRNKPKSSSLSYEDSNKLLLYYSNGESFTRKHKNQLLIIFEKKGNQTYKLIGYYFPPKVPVFDPKFCIHVLSGKKKVDKG